jgi:hypothetical protein
VNRNATDRGLRHRLQRGARRVADQHQAIRDLYRALTEDLLERPKKAVRSGFDRYRLALTAHFDLEEQIFFPAVHGADPGQSAQLRQLIDSHARMRTELEHIADSIDSLPTDEFSRRLVGFSTILASHEQQEECLLSQVIDLSLHQRESTVCT